jgi:hypothetical protein
MYVEINELFDGDTIPAPIVRFLVCDDHWEERLA